MLSLKNRKNAKFIYAITLNNDSKYKSNFCSLLELILDRTHFILANNIALTILQGNRGDRLKKIKYSIV